MGFRNIVIPDIKPVNEQELGSARQVPKQGLFQTIEVGAGGKTFKMDERGIWMGSNDWETAPFKVDMNGNIVIRASETTIDTSIKFIDADGNESIFIGFKDV